MAGEAGHVVVVWSGIDGASCVAVDPDCEPLPVPEEPPILEETGPDMGFEAVPNMLLLDETIVVPLWELMVLFISEMELKLPCT